MSEHITLTNTITICLKYAIAVPRFTIPFNKFTSLKENMQLKRKILDLNEKIKKCSSIPKKNLSYLTDSCLTVDDRNPLYSCICFKQNY